eukprot:12347771-Ditylum_brightwellii.AAC.1
MGVMAYCNHCWIMLELVFGTGAIEVVVAGIMALMCPVVMIMVNKHMAMSHVQTCASCAVSCSVAA